MKYETFLVLVVSKTKRMRKEMWVRYSSIDKRNQNEGNCELFQTQYSQLFLNNSNVCLELLHSFSSIISFEFDAKHISLCVVKKNKRERERKKEIKQSNRVEKMFEK
jgi:hypothetical protein